MNGIAEALLRRAASRDAATRPSAEDAALMVAAAGAIRMAEAEGRAAEERDHAKLGRAAAIMQRLMKDGAEEEASKDLLRRLRDPVAVIPDDETLRFHHSSDHDLAREASASRDALGDALCRIWKLQESYAAPFPARVVAAVSAAWDAIPEEVRKRNGYR